MAKRHLHGLESENELQEESLYRDTRSMQQKFFDWCKKPQNMAFMIFIHAAVAFVMPILSDFCLMSASVFFLVAMRRKESCPLKMPAQSGLFDPNQDSKAKGIFFLGNQKKTGKEIWLTNDDCRQHFLVIGTTGAGKTETLLGFAANSLLWGSGLLFCDGKGDVSVFAKLYALTRRFGREDDLLVLNFMTGNSDISGGGKIKSNTINPFSTGSSDSLTQMIVSLMDDAGGDNAMWKGRATAMLTGVMRALCWLRDNGIIELNVGEIRDFMGLPKIMELADAEKYPEMPAPIRGSIKSYLGSIPGFDEKKPLDKMSQQVRDQHGFLEMQFTKILGSLADVYGHIFKAEYGEVDMTDVVLNRRILFIMLPALEKSGDELANLGKIVVANLKGMMGSNLGSDIEGSWYDVVENRQTTSRAPFMTILDEVGYYAVEGLALMAAQARSLGFSMVYATQDIPAIERRNEKEAASIIANTNTKVFMRTEEVDKSGKLAVEAAGKAMKAQVSTYQGKSGEMGSGYFDSREARLEASDRVSFRDLKQQTEGEMHVIFKDQVVRANGLYANPEGSLDTKKLSLRANHFIPVVPPDLEELAADERLPEIMERLVDPEFANQLDVKARRLCDAADKDMLDEIALSRHMFQTMEEEKRSLTEAGGASIGAVADILSRNVDAFADNVRNIMKGEEDDEPEEHNEQIPVKSKHTRSWDDSADEEFANSDAPQKQPTSFMDLRKNAAQKKRHRSRLKDRMHGVTIDEDEPIDMGENIESNDTIMRALAAMNFDVENEQNTSESVEDSIDSALSLQDGSGKNTETDEQSDIDDLLLASSEVDESLGDVIQDEDAFVTIGDGDEEDKTQSDEGGEGDEGEPSDLAENFLRYLMTDEEEDETDNGEDEKNNKPEKDNKTTEGTDQETEHVNQDALDALSNLDDDKPSDK